jgi:hypothetical protein
VEQTQEEEEEEVHDDNDQRTSIIVTIAMIVIVTEFNGYGFVDSINHDETLSFIRQAKRNRSERALLLLVLSIMSLYLYL